MDNNMKYFCKLFEQTAANPLRNRLYVSLRGLIPGYHYLCYNFRVSTFVTGTYLTVEINETGSWVILPQSLFTIVMTNEEVNLRYLNSAGYCLAISGFTEGRAQLVFRKSARRATVPINDNHDDDNNE